jgi:hypothetical protein
VLHQEWIIGVYSLSEARPIKTAQFSPQDAAFVDAEHYTDWRFVHKPEGVQAAGSAEAIGAAQANTAPVSPSGELLLQSTGTPLQQGRTRPLAPTAP